MSSPIKLSLLSCFALTMLARLAAAEPAAACPEGSWDCEPAANQEPPPVAIPEPDLPELPPSSVEAPLPTAQGSNSGPPSIHYQDSPPPPPRAYAPPAPLVPVRKRPAPPLKWGAKLHLQGMMMDAGQASDSGMAGMGAAFRYRPQRHFALDFGLDFVAGRDYKGLRRSEIPFSISAIGYANPRDAAQIYVLGGLAMSHAEVEVDERARTFEGYDYFGAHFGLGVEVRMTRKLSLGVDLLGFVRGRTDRVSRDNPEFVDVETGETTNTSGGGLGRVGAIFYW